MESTADTLNAEGTRLAERGELVEAEAKYREVLALDPKHARAMNNLGNVLKRQGALDEAETHYRGAIELGGSARAKKNLVLLYLDRGKLREIDALCAACEPSDAADLWQDIATACELKQQTMRAGSAWLTARELLPDRAEISAGLSRTTVELGFGPALRILVPRANLITPYVLQEQGDWFEDEIHFVRRLLRAGDRAIDIGANFGVFALSIAKAIGPEGRVLAVEPASTTYRFLAESAARNGFPQLTLVNRAVSEGPGQATFFNANSPELSGLASAGTAGWTETVELTTLDALGDQLEGKATFLKLDAEGEEVRILAGGRRFFQQHEPLVMAELRHGQTINEGLLDSLKGYGMSLYRLAPGPLVLEPLSPADYDAPFLLNIFACVPRRAELLREMGYLVAAGERKRHAPSAAAIERAEARQARASRGASPYPRFAEVVRTYFLSAEEPDADQRLMGLRAAYEGALALPRSVASKCLLARTANDLGRRFQANNAALDALAQLHSSQGGDAVVSPIASFDEEPIRTTAKDWAEAALLEFLLHRFAYSSIFDPPNMLDFAKKLAALPHPSERAKKVLQLAGASPTGRDS